MRIVITGGHHTSALVVAQKLIKKGHQVFWLGHKYSMWGDQEPCAEYREVGLLGIPFYELKAGKYQPTLNPIKLVRLPLGFLQALFYLLQIRPNLIVSFGGYLAVPTVLVGWLLKIPAITHEQSSVSGLANKIVAYFAQKILVSWPSSLPFFPKEKTTLVGLPLRGEIFEKTTTRFDFKNHLPTIYITGGKQGAHVINQAIFSCLESLLENYNLIHQCGSSTLHHDFKRAQEKKRQLELKKRKRYIVSDYFYPTEIGSVFAQADLVVSRAGAHMVFELAALGKPAILIPIPWLYGDEQTKNAKLLKKTGLVEILPQDQLSGEKLSWWINKVVENIESYRKNAKKAKNLIRLDAGERIVEEIEATVKK